MNGLRLLVLSMLILVKPLFAQGTGQDNSADTEDKLGALIASVSAAYGGDALLSLRNYQITESYVSPNTGQSWHPALTDIRRFNFRLVHDLEAGHVYQESWFNSRSGRFPNINILNADGAWSVDLRGARFGESANGDPYAVAGGIMRTTDVLLARELIKSAAEAQYLGEALWMNRDHRRVRIPFPLSSDLTLFVDAESGLITRMTRESPQLGLLDYVFLEHAVTDGFTAAQTVNFSIAGDPNLMGSKRAIRFNQVIDPDTFTIPDGLAAEGARVDDSEMLVNRLSDEVYHVGQNGGYSIFVDTGREIVAAGTYAGLGDRLTRFRQETGNYLPLAYQVVTHHHSDHIAGIDEALALGARLVTKEDTAPVLRASSQQEIDDASLLLVDERLTLGTGNGEVQIFDVSTSHAANNLLFYVPAVRTLFIADHFGSPFADGIPDASGNTVAMAAALAPLELGFRRIVTAHSGRVFTSKEFAESVEAYTEYQCPSDKPLCSS
ncbi:MAG: MBL fold metallo-hydrolase [Congregibacter sp.]